MECADDGQVIVLSLGRGAEPVPEECLTAVVIDSPAPVGCNDDRNGSLRRDGDHTILQLPDA